MNRGSCAMICLVVALASSCVWGETLRPPAPQLCWKVGDSWKVRTWLMKMNMRDRSAKPEKGPPVDFTFAIRRLISTSDFQPPYLRDGLDRVRYGYPRLPADGYQCFEIEVAGPPRSSGALEKHFLYFRRDTGNLIRILDILGKKEGLTNKITFDFSPDPNGPVIDEMRWGLTGGMFTFPDFTKDPNFVCERRRGKADEAKEVITQTITSRRVKSRDGTEHEEYEVTILVSRGTSEFKTIQKWRQDDAWWFETKHVGGELRLPEAILIQWADGPEKGALTRDAQHDHSEAAHAIQWHNKLQETRNSVPRPLGFFTLDQQHVRGKRT